MKALVSLLDRAVPSLKSQTIPASTDDLEWNDKSWFIVNHFIPFKEDEVNAPNRFESDFMVQYMVDKKFPKEAKTVLNAGRTLWKTYFSTIDTYNIRHELKLNRADVGLYQIRNALKKRNQSGDKIEIDFSQFEEAYKDLSQKLRPLVFDLGFLRD